MITKFARLEFELFTKPSNSDFYEFIKFVFTDLLNATLSLLGGRYKQLTNRTVSHKYQYVECIHKYTFTQPNHGL